MKKLFVTLILPAVLLLGRAAPAQSHDPTLDEPLLDAASTGNYPAVQRLLENGAAIETTDADGQTPLLKAANAGQVHIVMLLLDKGANIEAAGNLPEIEGRTALMEAAFKGYTEIVLLLLDKGANIEAADRHGLTALFLAVAGTGNPHIVRILLGRNAYTEVKDDDDERR
jgi:ankyrin repeat protein